MNQIQVIQPYRYADTWVFDDPRVDLVQEPFVCGVSEMIDTLATHIPNAETGIRLLFSADRFPGAREFEHVRDEDGGAWYRDATTRAEGWLCPALMLYFAAPPRRLYAKAESLRDAM